MGETLNLLFRKRDDGTFEIEAQEGQSEHVICGNFIPPINARQINALLKKLNTFESDDRELREIGQLLYQSLFGSTASGTERRESSEQSIRAVLRGVIQNAIRRCGSVALTLSFTLECHKFVRYPWELLHNDEYFLLASGVFTLTRALVRPDMPSGKELPVHPPLRILYIGASPVDCPPLEIESSYEAMEQGLSSLREDNRLLLERLDPPTFDELVRYLNSRGGAGAFDERDIAYPCYAIHFDGHGAFRRQCPADDCDELNALNAQFCNACGTSLRSVDPQTFLCFCDNEGKSRLIDTETLRELFVNSDVRLAVFAACETAMLSQASRTRSHRQTQAAIDATLATSLVASQVPAVIAMPFSIEDKLSPTFMFHFYEALASGRTLEEALSRARQAMLPLFKHHGWFIPVLYRHVIQGHDGPVAFLAVHNELEEQEHSLAQLGAAQNFVGRERELQELNELLTQAVVSDEKRRELKSQHVLRPGVHHIAITGPAGIGKSALAIEAVKRNREKFHGGSIGISLQGGKLFAEALIELAKHLHIPTQGMHTANIQYCEQVVLDSYRNLANRGFHCLLLLDRFDEVQERSAVGAWLRFLCALPTQVVVLLTSHSNPDSVAVLEGAICHWYEHRVDKMESAELLKLFTELAETSGLAERIQLDDPEQQAILEEICTLLDGYPLGAELIFGRTQSINGKVFAPEAATRSLEEVRDELVESQLEGMAAVFEVSYKLLSEPARQLLPYLAVFTLPFSHEQIAMLVEPKSAATTRTIERLESERALEGISSEEKEDVLRAAGSIFPTELQKNWRGARDELVQASFVQFDGRHYHVHAQVRHFAHTLLPSEEHKRTHRVAAAYYSSLPHPSAEQWFAAFEHLEEAGEVQDVQKAIHLAVSASWDLQDRGRATEVVTMLERAQNHALHVGDKTGEGKIQCRLGGILRQQGHYAQALGCLTRSASLHHEQNESDEEGWALYELAMLYREEGHFQQAGEHAQRALELFQKAGDMNGVAWMQMVLAEVSRGYGRYHEAQEQLNEVLTNFHKLNNEVGYAHVLYDRSTIYEALGQYTEALVDSEESLRLFTKLGLRFWQAWVLSEQSAVFLDQGKYDQAERTCSEAITILREQKALRGEAWALRVLGDIARKRRNFIVANDYYNQSLALFSKLGNRVDQSRVLNSLGANFLAEGQISDAKEHFEHARVLAHEQTVIQLEGRALRGLGDVAQFQKHFTEAERFYTEAATIATNLDTPTERGAVLHRQGELYQTQGKYREALSTWVRAYVEDQRIGHPDRETLKGKIDILVASHDLQEYYIELQEQYGIQNDEFAF
jgi:tetratricopeptide (TPR) repeat protein